MSTSKNFIAYVLDQISDPRAHTQSMFGEYALYYNDRVVGFICDDTVLLKITPNTTALLPHGEKWPAYPGSKDYYIIDDMLDDRDRLLELLQRCAADVPLKKKKK